MMLGEIKKQRKEKLEEREESGKKLNEARTE
jgi:hypothetical protein